MPELHDSLQLWACLVPPDLKGLQRVCESSAMDCALAASHGRIVSCTFMVNSGLSITTHNN